eukprot:522017-Rhodomonas_salina.1
MSYAAAGADIVLWTCYALSDRRIRYYPMSTQYCASATPLSATAGTSSYSYRPMQLLVLAHGTVSAASYWPVDLLRGV